MNWQDLIFAIGSIVFILALVPAVRSIEKPPRSTCALTGGVLWAFVPCYVTLALPLAAITGAGTALLWTILYFQKRLLTDPVEGIEEPQPAEYREPIRAGFIDA